MSSATDQQQVSQVSCAATPVAPAEVPTVIAGSAFSPTRRVGARGGPQLFAQKLFTLVEEEDKDIVEWLPDGLAFRVKDIARFSTEVLEKYFNREWRTCDDYPLRISSLLLSLLDGFDSLRACHGALTLIICEFAHFLGYGLQRTYCT